MIFKNKVQEQFKKAGWYEGRNEKSKIDNIKNFPENLIKFISMYGGLKVEDCKPYQSDVINTLDLDLINYNLPNTVFNSEINKQLYVIGYFYPDHYMVLLDNEDTVYMVGDYIFKAGDSLKVGIENILEDKWENILEWNFKDKKWQTE